MQARQELLYRDTLVVLERLSSIYGDDSVSQETLPTVLEAVDHVWSLLSMITIRNRRLTAAATGRQYGIHPQSEIGWGKTFNLFVRTGQILIRRHRAFCRCVRHWEGPFRRWFSLSLGWDSIQRYVNKMRRRITACIAQNGGHTRYWHITWIFSLFLLNDTPH